MKTFEKKKIKLESGYGIKDKKVVALIPEQKYINLELKLNYYKIEKDAFFSLIIEDLLCENKEFMSYLGKRLFDLDHTKTRKIMIEHEEKEEKKFKEEYGQLESKEVDGIYDIVDVEWDK